MNKRYGTGLGVALLVFASHVGAQEITPPAAAAPGPNLWNFLLPPCDKWDACKAKLADTALCEVLRNGVKPVTLATGGLLFSKCGIPNAALVNKLAEEGRVEESAAAKIKKSEAEMAARRDAVRYLGTVDCNYWPEAKAALINALRNDPSECVRYEAALALGRGCCCNKETLKALEHSANGDTKDGSPPEHSLRVRMAAHSAIAYCASVYALEETTEVEKEKEGPPLPKEIPLARGKGLFGIFASAAEPAKTPQKQGAPHAAGQQQLAHKPAAKHQGQPHLVKQAPVQPVNFRTPLPQGNVAQEPVAQEPVSQPVASPEQPSGMQRPVRKGLFQMSN